MIPGLGIALACAVAAAADDLPAARDAFAKGEYDRAGALALSAAQPPQEGAALYLAALSRFRAGDAGEALSLLDRARAAADPPPQAEWSYNRGACLYRLGRLAEAEAAFREAADLSSALAAVSLVQAGYAALEAGDRDRARALAVGAGQAAEGATAELVRELERAIAGTPEAGEPEGGDYALALAAYDAGRLSEARAAFRRLTERDPADGKSRIMAGATDLRLGDCAAARGELLAALALPLAARDAEVARDHLAVLDRDPGRSCLGFGGELRVGGGHDDNVIESAPGNRVSPGASASGASSGELDASARLRYRRALRPSLLAEASYDLAQVHYLRATVEDYGWQRHAAAVALELTARPSLRLGASLGGELTFTGQSRFRPLQAAGALSAWAALDHLGDLTTRLAVRLSPGAGLRREFAYLGGLRAGLGLEEELRLGPLALAAGYAFRLDRVGTFRQDQGLAPPAECGPRCAQESVIPLAHRSSIASLSARAWLGRRLELQARGAAEWRDYLTESFVRFAPQDGEAFDVDRRQRHDLRLSTRASLAWTPWRGLGLLAYHELLWSRSNVASRTGGAHAYDYDDKNFVRHAIGAEAFYRW